MPETGYSRTDILGKLNLSVHGKLSEYIPIIYESCSKDPEFLAHLIAFDYVNGQIKDSKIALPVITLTEKQFPEELLENSLAHLAMAPPREMLRALRFSIASNVPAGRQKKLERMIRRYLAHKEGEPGKWARLAARHRRPLKALYALTHAPMAPWASDILFGAHYAPGSIFAAIANLHNEAPAAVAAAIQKWHLSPLVVSGAMAGAKAKQDDAAVVQATMDQMSDTELVTRVKKLEKQGVTKDDVLKEKLRQKISKATKSKKATLKTSVAAEEVEDEGLKEMLKELQERQIQAQKDAGRGIDGNWLVIVDKSGSQEIAIETGKHIAAAIAKFVTGKVWLAFCDTSGVGKEVTGMTLEQIQQDSKFVRADGGTSYGVGLDWAMRKGLDIDGVAIVGDGGENNYPLFSQAWKAYRDKKELAVYFYQTATSPQYRHMTGEFERFMRESQVPLTKYDLTKGQIDYYALPNLVQGMNVQRFGVIEKILACPLLTLDQVLPVAATAVR